MKQARPELPKTAGRKAKPARPELPKTEAKGRAWKTVLVILGLLLWTGVSVIVSQLIVGHIMLAILGAETLAQPAWSATYSALSYILALVLIILVPKKISRKEIGMKGLPTWTDIGLAPVGYFVYLLLAGALTLLFSLIPGFDAAEAQDVGFSLTIGGVDRIIAFVTLVVVAPIAEEIIFRGWLYGKLRKKLSGLVSDVVGIVISILLVSLLFGIVHLQWNVGVNVFALSVVMCLLREFTGTIYSGMLLHMLKNGIAFYLLYVVGTV